MPEAFDSARSKRAARGYKFLIFDLDGTLVDSVPDLAFTVDQMLVDLGHSPAGEARNLRGQNLRGQNTFPERRERRKVF
jgi:phosphoglycolate phosphatase-like HAD superfamily hydrolase